MLKGKKCPRAGIVVQTKGGFVGATTGDCGPRKSVVVAIVGLGTSTFKRSELTKLGKRQEARLAAEMKRVQGAGRASPRSPPVYMESEVTAARVHPTYWESEVTAARRAAPQPVPSSINSRAYDYDSSGRMAGFHGLGALAGKSPKVTAVNKKLTLKKKKALRSAVKESEKAFNKAAAASRKLRSKLDVTRLSPEILKEMRAQMKDDTAVDDLARAIIHIEAGQARDADWEPYIPQHARELWTEYTPLTVFDADPIASNRSPHVPRRFEDERYQESDWNVSEDRVGRAAHIKPLPYGPFPQRKTTALKPGAYASRRTASKFSGW